jgi:hypothetical protein
VTGPKLSPVQAFQIQNKDAIEVSAPITFDGPITALWTGADQSSVTAVSKNRTNETYEVFSLSITCSR